jgi:hypothetical protein
MKKYTTFKTIIYLISICFLSSSCATMVRSHNTGDGKAGFCLQTKGDEPITVTCEGKTLKSSILYDGNKYQSPFTVYKYYLPRMYKEVKLTVQKGGKTEGITLYRHKDKGWFWVEGLVFWMYESIAGKLFYYDDVVAYEQ